MKLHSETVTHKTDVGGVKLNLVDETAVRRAFSGNRSFRARRRRAATRFSASPFSRCFRREGYELILGSSVDPQFGPVMLFGSGGQLVEVYRDRALGPAAAQHHARAAADRADARLQSAAGRARPREPIDLDKSQDHSGALQQADRRAAVDQGDRYQSAARVSRAHRRARRPRDSPRRRTLADRNCRARRSGRTRRNTSGDGPRRTARRW